MTKKARFRMKMVRTQSPFKATNEQQSKRVPNPFENRITQQELDEGLFTFSLDQIAETYSEGQIQSLMDEMHFMSEEYEAACIDRLLALKK